MGATKDLATYIATLNFADLPAEVTDRAKSAILDTVGLIIGGSELKSYTDPFVDVALATGGEGNAPIIGRGVSTTAPMAAFANAASATALDYADHMSSVRGICFGWPGSMAIPAALAILGREASGEELITAVVAGYETLGRLLYSQDMTDEVEDWVKGETVSVFAATATAGRALGLTPDQMLSAFNMAGAYTPVSGGYKWLMDVGLRPRRDIKQGWAWMAHTGVFAAVSAKHGLQALQENSALDGERGLWRQLGMDIYTPEALTENLGSYFHILRTATKVWPGCYISHMGIVGAREAFAESGATIDDIESIEVVTNKRSGVEEDDQNPKTAQDMQFSAPYQVAAALTGAPRGVAWYESARPAALALAERTTLSFDEECDVFWRTQHRQMSKVRLRLKNGKVIDKRIEDQLPIQTKEDMVEKFVEGVAQIHSEEATEKILRTIETLEGRRVGELLDLLR